MVLSTMKITGAEFRFVRLWTYLSLRESEEANASRVGTLASNHIRFAQYFTPWRSYEVTPWDDRIFLSRISRGSLGMSCR